MKAAVERVEQQYAFSQRRACSLLMVAVLSVRYQVRSSDEDLREGLVELAREKPRFGYRRLHVLLRRSGELVNHKRVHRVYREAGLTLRRKKRKHCARQSAPLRQYTAANAPREPRSGCTPCQVTICFAKIRLDEPFQALICHQARWSCCYTHRLQQTHLRSSTYA